MRPCFLLFLWFTFSVLAHAQPRGQIVAIDDFLYVAMLDESIENCVTVQEKENWCWAACIEMILRYHGVENTQSDIVDFVFDTPYDWTASGNEIANAFDGFIGFSVQSFKTKNAQSFINEISAGHPLLIGYKEHAYLLTHIYYKKTSSGSLNPFKAIMINPATGNEEVFDWSVLYSNINTIISFHR